MLQQQQKVYVYIQEKKNLFTIVRVPILNGEHWVL